MASLTKKAQSPAMMLSEGKASTIFIRRSWACLLPHRVQVPPFRMGLGGE